MCKHFAGIAHNLLHERTRHDPYFLESRRAGKLQRRRAPARLAECDRVRRRAPARTGARHASAAADHAARPADAGRRRLLRAKPRPARRLRRSTGDVPPGRRRADGPSARRHVGGPGGPHRAAAAGRIHGAPSAPGDRLEHGRPPRRPDPRRLRLRAALRDAVRFEPGRTLARALPDDQLRQSRLPGGARGAADARRFIRPRDRPLRCPARRQRARVGMVRRGADAYGAGGRAAHGERYRGV